MLRFIIFAGLLTIPLLNCRAQDTIRTELGGYPVSIVITDGDTILVSHLDEVVIQPRNRQATRDLRQYRRLIYNVKKVYPYAKLAGTKFAEINTHLQGLETKGERREYIKKMEDEIIRQYQEELKDLTITQGRILIKLVDRETSQTSYEVVKELRGAFQAAIWQAIARLFGSNLKSEYDAEGEDKMIEEIMLMIERGEL